MPREVSPDAGAAFSLLAALEARLGRVSASDMSSQRGLQAPAAALNLPQLDTLVRQYMVVEDIVEGDGEDDVSRKARRQCEAVRDAVRQADVAGGLLAADAVDASVLQDQRLLFQLKKQELIEVLRRSKSYEDALACVRAGLAALALDAYPEAYSEFKHLMLAFVYDPESAPPSVAELWKPAQRIKLADVLAATLKQAVGGFDSDFTTLLRYLLVTSRSFHAMRDRGAHTCSTACTLAKDLLLPDRAARPLHPEIGGTFPEATVQALTQAAEMSREDAIAALKLSGGDVDRALRAELGCFRLNAGLLEELAWEYALSRDLVRAPADSLMRDANDEEGAAEAAAAITDRPTSRAASPTRDDREDADGAACGNWRQRSRSPPPKKLARWRTHQQSAEDGAAASGASLATEKFAAALKVKQAAQAGRFADVEAELRRLDDRFTDNHPRVLFEVRRCQFSALVEAGKQQEALAFARTQLTPLAGGDDGLMREVKAVMGAILIGGAPAVTREAAAAGLQKSVCEALGLQEPRLVDLLATLLSVHAAYFHRQRCKDRFEGALGISALRSAVAGGADGAAAAAQPVPEAVEPATAPAHDHHMDPVDSEDDEDDEMERDGGGDDGEVTEENILLTMEFTGLPRVQVIELLLVHGNDPQVVMQTLFQ